MLASLRQKSSHVIFFVHYPLPLGMIGDGRKGQGREREWHTSSKSGCGLPLQKFDRVQVAFRSMDSLELSFSCIKSGIKALCPRTRFLQAGESPAIFPKAHTACRIITCQARIKCAAQWVLLEVSGEWGFIYQGKVRCLSIVRPLPRSAFPGSATRVLTFQIWTLMHFYVQIVEQ